MCAFPRLFPQVILYCLFCRGISLLKKRASSLARLRVKRRGSSSAIELYSLAITGRQAFHKGFLVCHPCFCRWPSIACRSGKVLTGSRQEGHRETRSDVRRDTRAKYPKRINKYIFDSSRRSTIYLNRPRRRRRPHSRSAGTCRGRDRRAWALACARSGRVQIPVRGGGLNMLLP